MLAIWTFFHSKFTIFNSSLFFSSETSSNWIRTQPSRIKPNHENKDSYSYDQKFIQIYHPKSRGFLSVDLDGDLSHTTSLNDNRSKSIGFILVLPTHSVELSGTFCHSDFTWNQFGEYRSSETAVFAIFGALNYVNLVNHSFQNVQKFLKTIIQSIEMW